MFKKQSVFLTYNNFHSPQNPATLSKTSPSRLTQRSQQQCRSYAMISNGRSGHKHGGIPWPEMTSAGRIPTPYQIFNQKKGSPYSKQRFYELVKLYHPDRHDLDSSMDGLSYATKMERYRLVVAANEILSDPVKRSAFDIYGAGWNGMPDVKSPKDSCNSSTTWTDKDGSGWNAPGGPSQNATWEDWERWYARHDGREKQEPQFVSNGAFVGLIVMFAIIGGVGQATRAGNFSVSFLEQRDALHENLSKDLIRRRKETTSLWGSREERIHSFLKQREPVGYDDITHKEEELRKLLPAPEMLSSEDVKRRPVDMSKHFSNPKDD